MGTNNVNENASRRMLFLRKPIFLVPSRWSKGRKYCHLDGDEAIIDLQTNVINRQSFYTNSNPSMGKLDPEANFDRIRDQSFSFITTKICSNKRK